MSWTDMERREKADDPVENGLTDFPRPLPCHLDAWVIERQNTAFPAGRFQPGTATRSAAARQGAGILGGIEKIPACG